MYYRKYRPQKFSELDSEKIRETLGRATLQGEVFSAYLLTGPKGTGKTSAARLIAKTVNCTGRKNGEEPCNKCESCKAITSGRSLDVIEIDAASNTGVEDIRDLREKVKLATSGSKYKVYIVDEVHMLSTAAFNALLKTLEEPPAHVIFVLATTDPQKMPETVKSRCQEFDFGKGTPEEVMRALERAVRGEGLEVSREILGKIAKKAGGSFRDAHKILEQYAATGTLPGNLGDLRDLGGLLKSKDRAGALEWLNKYGDKNGNIKELITGLTEIFREELLEGDGSGQAPHQNGAGQAKMTEILRRLEQAYGELRDTPIASLPMELLIVEYCQKDDDSKEVDWWGELLEKLKPVNHNLVALMRAAKLKEVADENLTIEVAYKFHLEKLEEIKNKEAVTRIISDIMGRPIRIKFELGR